MRHELLTLLLPKSLLQSALIDLYKYLTTYLNCHLFYTHKHTHMCIHIDIHTMYTCIHTHVNTHFALCRVWGLVNQQVGHQFRRPVFQFPPALYCQHGIWQLSGRLSRLLGTTLGSNGCPKPSAGHIDMLPLKLTAWELRRLFFSSSSLSSPSSSSSLLKPVFFGGRSKELVNYLITFGTSCFIYLISCLPVVIYRACRITNSGTK